MVSAKLSPVELSSVDATLTPQELEIVEAMLWALELAMVSSRLSLECVLFSGFTSRAVSDLTSESFKKFLSDGRPCFLGRGLLPNASAALGRGLATLRGLAMNRALAIVALFRLSCSVATWLVGGALFRLSSSVATALTAGALFRLSSGSEAKFEGALLRLSSGATIAAQAMEAREDVMTGSSSWVVGAALASESVRDLERVRDLDRGLDSVDSLLDFDLRLRDSLLSLDS